MQTTTTSNTPIATSQPSRRSQPHRPSWLILVLGLALVVGGAILMPTYAAPGNLDPTFGSGGIVRFASFSARAFAMQDDDKIIVAGNTDSDNTIVLARYTSAGTLDPSFGNGGIVITERADDSHRVYDVALRPDGYIIVSGIVDAPDVDGRSANEMFLARYTTTGALDPTFGNGGIVIAHNVNDGQDSIYKSWNNITVQPDHKIVLIGSVVADVNAFSFVARFYPDGSPDMTLGGDGLIGVGQNGYDDAHQIALQPDGKMLLAVQRTYHNREFQVERYHVDGTLDLTFGNAGSIGTPVGHNDTIASLALQDDGKLVIAGSTPRQNGTSALLIARYWPDGSLDTTFGSNGVVVGDFGKFEYGRAVALQDDGSIIIAGKAHQYPRTYPMPPDVPTDNHDIFLARYRPDGSLDPTFGNGGSVTTDLDDDEDTNGVALQANGQVIVFSSERNGNVLLRYQAAGVLPQPRDTPTPVTRTSVLKSAGYWKGLHELRPHGSTANPHRPGMPHTVEQRSTGTVQTADAPFINYLPIVQR